MMRPPPSDPRWRALARPLLGALGAAVLLSPGCAPPAPRPGPPLAQALLEQTIARRRNFGPFVATFTARVRRRPAWFAAVTFSGVLAVAPPGRLRAQLLIPAGLTAQDLTVSDGRYRLRLPLQDRTERGTTCAPYDADCEQTNPGLMLAWLFTHERSCRDAPCTTSGDGPRYQIAMRVGPGLGFDATVVLEDGEPIVVAEEIRRDEAAWIRVEYADHRAVDGLTVPHRIRLADARTGVEIALDMHSYRRAPTLPEETFLTD
jgi:hypothetical protein